MKEKLSPERIIDLLKMAPHPEGGHFVETYRSRNIIPIDCLSNEFKEAPPFSTSIYYLLQSGECSKLHRLLSDEIWHYYAGCPLIISIIKDFDEITEIKLGPDIANGERYQATVPAGFWFGAYPGRGNSYVLAACSMSPGFEFANFEMGDKIRLIEEFPNHRELIEKLS